MIDGGEESLRQRIRHCDVLCIGLSQVLNGDRVGCDSSAHDRTVTHFIDREVRGRYRIKLIVILFADTSWILREVRQSVTVVIHAILTLGLRERFIVIRRCAAAEVLWEVDSAIVIVIDAVVALLHRGAHVDRVTAGERSNPVVIIACGECDEAVADPISELVILA